MTPTYSYTETNTPDYTHSEDRNTGIMESLRGASGLEETDFTARAFRDNSAKEGGMTVGNITSSLPSIGADVNFMPNFQLAQAA
jgi:hypothetical protein